MVCDVLGWGCVVVCDVWCDVMCSVIVARVGFGGLRLSVWLILRLSLCVFCLCC